WKPSVVMSDRKHLAHLEDVRPLVCPYGGGRIVAHGIATADGKTGSGGVLLCEEKDASVRAIALMGTNDAETYALLHELAEGCTIGELRSIGRRGIRKLIDLMQREDLIR